MSLCVIDDGKGKHHSFEARLMVETQVDNYEFTGYGSDRAEAIEDLEAHMRSMKVAIDVALAELQVVQ